MAKYTLFIEGQDKPSIKLPLFSMKDSLLTNNYFDSKNKDLFVYENTKYKFSVPNTPGDDVIRKLFINGENISNWSRKSAFFNDCYGFVQFKVIIDEDLYATQAIKVAINETSYNKYIENMIEYIDQNSAEYLHNNQKGSQFKVSLFEKESISIEKNFLQLNDIYDTYINCYNSFKYAAQSKLTNIDSIGNFEDLQNVSNKTLNFIVTHPAELTPVCYNSGISACEQYYQPRRVLIQSLTYSTDIYENQVIINFLRKIIKYLMDLYIETQIKKDNLSKNHKDSKCDKGYTDSTNYIFKKAMQMVTNYESKIDSYVAKFEKLLSEYNKILPVTTLETHGKPKYTDIFKKVRQYNLIYKRIINWLKYDKCNMERYDLMLTFISSSLIYEYFCLLKITNSLVASGYEYIRGYEFNNYPANTPCDHASHHNTFEFKKGDISIKVFYQPFYDHTNLKKKKINGIDLYRTSTSGGEGFELIKKEGWENRTYYTPDYIIKDLYKDKTYYIMLDAKYMPLKNIKLADLVYKYLYSTKTIDNESVFGLAILCGKDYNKYNRDINDVASEYNLNIKPWSMVLSVTGQDVYDNTTLLNLIENIETKITGQNKKKGKIS